MFVADEREGGRNQNGDEEGLVDGTESVHERREEAQIFLEDAALHEHHDDNVDCRDGPH